MQNRIMFIRIVSKSLLVKKGKLALAVLAITLAISLVTAFVVISLGVGSKLEKVLSAYGANFILTAGSDRERADKLLGRKVLSWLRQAKDQHYIDKFAPYIYTLGELEGERVLIIGVDFIKTREMNPWWRVRGHWPDKNLSAVHGKKREGKKKPTHYGDSSGEYKTTRNQQFVLVGVALAKRLGIRIGDQITVKFKHSQRAASEGKLTESCFDCHLNILNRHRKLVVKDHSFSEKICLNCHGLHREQDSSQIFTISGLVDTDEEENNQALFLHLPLVKTLTGLAGVHKIEVRARLTKLSETEFQEKLQTALKSVEIQPVKEVSKAEAVLLSKIQLLIGLIAAVVINVAVITVFSLMTARLLERSVEIGLMKALGASNWSVIASLLVEAGIIGISGGGLGFILGFLEAQLIASTVFGSAISFNWLAPPFSLLAAVLVSVVASLIPVKRSTTIEPAIILRGE